MSIEGSTDPRCGSAAADLSLPAGIQLAGYGVDDRAMTGVHDPLQAKTGVLSTGATTAGRRLRVDSRELDLPLQDVPPVDRLEVRRAEVQAGIERLSENGDYEVRTTKVAPEAVLAVREAASTWSRRTGSERWRGVPPETVAFCSRSAGYRT
ncbi:MAG: hypothetical protein V5A28_04545 [Haloarculaceae archaeon]